MSEEQAESGSKDAIDAGWRIHGVLVDWTGKVDTKASFALTLESALLTGIVVLSGAHHRLYNLSGFWPLAFYWVGVGVLIFAALSAATVVLPRVRRSAVVQEARDNYIYFGHLRSWDPVDLQEALQTRDVLPVLSRQLVNMSKIAWTKHMRVQVSLILAAFGALLVGLAAIVR